MFLESEQRHTTNIDQSKISNVKPKHHHFQYLFVPVYFYMFSSQFITKPSDREQFRNTCSFQN